MTPLELLALIVVLILVRLVLSLRRPVALSTTAQPLASGGEASSPRDIIREYLDSFIVAGLIALLLITFVVRTYYIPSASMVPTLAIHDVLLVNEFEYRFHAPNDGDVVVFPPPIPATNDFIKRVIAGPGETLRIHNGIVYRNGQPLDEPYIAQKPNYELEVKDYGISVDGIPLDPHSANIPPRKDWSAPDRLPAQCYFMMGDNRNDSEDSHIWGFAQNAGVFKNGPLIGQPAHFTGHAFVVFWPLDRIHLLRRH